MHGSGDNEVILYPNRMVSIVMAKAALEVLARRDPLRRRAGDDPRGRAARAILTQRSAR